MCFSQLPSCTVLIPRASGSLLYTKFINRKKVNLRIENKSEMKPSCLRTSYCGKRMHNLCKPNLIHTASNRESRYPLYDKIFDKSLYSVIIFVVTLFYMFFIFHCRYVHSFLFESLVVVSLYNSGLEIACTATKTA